MAALPQQRSALHPRAASRGTNGLRRVAEDAPSSTTMAASDEMMHEIGGFEPSDLKKILDALAAAEIRFEIEADHTQLLASDRTFQMAFGMYPPGSRVLVFVPESRVADAQAVIARLFPV